MRFSFLKGQGFAELVSDETTGQQKYRITSRGMIQYEHKMLRVKGQIMHYKNGRPARPGDKVINLPSGLTGIVHSVSVSSDTCNARLAIPTQNDPYVTLKECLHVDDVVAASIPDSTVAAP